MDQKKENIPDVDEFKSRACCLKWTDEGYQHPEPKDVAELIQLTGWSQNDVAKIVGVNFDAKRGSSTIRKWKTQKSKDDHRPIPYSAWRLMLLYAKVVNVD